MLAALLIILAGAPLLLLAAILIAPRVTLRGVFRLLLPLFRVELRGAEHLQSSGPMVYVANHTSLLDAPLLIALIERRLDIVAHTAWANWWPLRMLRKAFRISPIDPQRPMSAKHVARRVSEGAAALIFPEGRITVTGAPMKVNAGAAWLVDASKARICAIHIEGLDRTKLAKPDTGWRRIWLPRVRVSVLPPQNLPVAAELRGKARRDAVLRALRQLTEHSRFTALNRHENILEAIDEARKTHGNGAIAYEDMLGNVLSRKKLAIGGAAIARMLEPHTKAGDTVGFLLPTAPGAMAVLMGIWRRGLVPAMINPTVGPAAVAASLGVVRADTVISSRIFVTAGKLDGLVAALEADGIRFIWMEDLRAGFGLGGKLRALREISAIPADVGRDTPAAILFTSGTEGTPKAVVLTHGNILANIAQVRARADVGPHDVAVSALPAFHSFGLTAGMILPLICGIRTGLHPSPLHYRIIPEFVYSMQATLLFGTDTFLNGWARRADPSDFSSLRAVVAGAEAVKESTRKIWSDRFGVRVLEGYGATECAPVLSLTPPSEPDIGTVGRLLPGMEMKLEPVAGVEGMRLHVRGPNVMAGYMLASDPGRLQPPADGWYDTGDIVDVGPDGLIRIIGRAKRFAKVGGEMVSLQSVELLAQKLWPDDAVAAISRPHPKTGEQVILCTSREGATRSDLLEFGRSRGVGGILMPAAVIAGMKIPMLASGKTDYPALARQMSEAGGALAA